MDPVTPKKLDTPAAVVDKAAEPGSQGRESEQWKQALSVKAKLLADQQKLADERAAFAKEKADAEIYKKAMADAKKTKGMSLLKGTGITYEDLTAAHLAGDAVDPVADVNEKIAALEKQRQDDAAARIESEKAQYTQQTQLAIKQLATQIDGMGEKFPLVHALKRSQQLAQAIFDHYEKTGEIVNAEVGAASLEKDLAASVPTEFETLLANPTLRALYKAAVDKLDAAAVPEKKPRAAAKPKEDKDAPAAKPAVKNGVVKPADLFREIRNKAYSRQ